MKFIKENLVEIFILLGFGFIAIGTFILNVATGFIITGILLAFIAYLIYLKGGD